MATESVRVSELIPAPCERVYAAWLDSREHTAMTGGEAVVEVKVGGDFTAWDGYIKGKNLALEPGRRIVQSWRSTDFPDESPDSRLELLLEATGGGTQVTILHTGIPEGQGADYEAGWRDYYFKPMRKYFATARPQPAPPPSVPVAPPPHERAPRMTARPLDGTRAGRAERPATARVASPLAKRPPGKAAPARTGRPTARQPAAVRATKAAAPAKAKQVGTKAKQAGTKAKQAGTRAKASARAKQAGAKKAARPRAKATPKHR